MLTTTYVDVMRKNSELGNISSGTRHEKLLLDGYIGAPSSLLLELPSLLGLLADIYMLIKCPHVLVISDP